MGGQLVVEDMSQLLAIHADTRVGYRHLHVVWRLVGTDGHATLVGKLACIVGQGVQHEERQYAVGLHDGLRRLHVEGDALHLETLAAAGENVEQRLQRETLDMQVELSLVQLNPMREHLVVAVYLVDEFTDVLLVAPPVDGIDHAVDERQQTVDERNLGPLLQVAPFALLEVQAADVQLFAALLNLLVERAVGLLAAIQPTEEPQQEEQQDDGSDNGKENPVQLADHAVELFGTRFKLAVLSRLLLQVEVAVAVVVAGNLVVDGGIGYAELLADAGHEVGSLQDG